MYVCLSCGHLFEEGEEKKTTEITGENFYSCPICGGDFEEADSCEECGAYSSELCYGYCGECSSRVKKSFEKLMNDNFTEKERDLLNNLYDGMRF